MRSIKRFHLVLALILTGLLLGACGLTPEEQAATHIAGTAGTWTSTPSPSLTLTPTITPTPTPSPSPTITLTPTPTISPFMSFIESYCGPELANWSSWRQPIEMAAMANEESEPSLELICHRNEVYYFLAKGFNPDEGISLTDIYVKSPISDFSQIEVLGDLGVQDGMFVYTHLFQGSEPTGEYTIKIKRDNQPEVSTTFTYTPTEQTIVIDDKEVDEDGYTNYVAFTSGWENGETLYLSAETPYGLYPRVKLGTVEGYGTYGPFYLPGLPPDALSGNYISKVEGEINEATITIYCSNESICEPKPTYKEWAQKSFEIGQEEYQAGYLEDALSSYEEAIEFYPENAEAYNLMAWILLNDLDTEYKKALDYALKSVEILPYSHNLDTLGLAYYKNNDYQNALLYYDLAIFFNTELSYSYLGRGDVYLALGNKKAAIENYEAYLALETDASEREKVEEKIDTILGD